MRVRVCVPVAHFGVNTGCLHACSSRASVKCPGSCAVTGCGVNVALPPASVPASRLNICTCAECVTVPGSERSVKRIGAGRQAAVSGSLHFVAFCRNDATSLFLGQASFGKELQCSLTETITLNSHFLKD